MADSARDPYFGLHKYIGNEAAKQIPNYMTIGKILSLQPLKIRADGMDLDRTDLRIAQSLLSGFPGVSAQLQKPITSDIPTKTLYGTCSCSGGAGTCSVTRSAESITGKDVGLSVGDEVLLLLPKDGQTYYVIERMVQL